MGRKVFMPVTIVRIFDFYLVAVGPWVITGLAA